MLGSSWRTVFPAVQTAAAITDSGRPVPMTIRSKEVGSIGSSNGDSLIAVFGVVPIVGNQLADYQIQTNLYENKPNVITKHLWKISTDASSITNIVKSLTSAI